MLLPAPLLDFVTAYNLRNRPRDYFNVRKIYTRGRSGNPKTLFESKVSCGFPSPALDHAKDRLTADDYLVSNEVSSFFVEVEGNSMYQAGIRDGDVVVVDKSLDPKKGDIVIAIVDGEHTCKELGDHCLIPHNPRYPTMYFKEDQEIQIWGVVIGLMRKFK